MFRRLLSLGIAAALTAGGCSQSDDAGTEETTSTTITAATTSITVTEATTADPGGPWELLYISDSFGRGVAERYGGIAEEVLGMSVNVHANVRDRLQAKSVLASLRDEASSPLADLVRDAEIIVVGPVGPTGNGGFPDWGTCMVASTAQRTPPKTYTEDDWSQYGETLDDLFGEIWHLREGNPTVLRAVTFPMPTISGWRAAGIESECKIAIESMMAAFTDAAEANGATVVSLLDLFNGPEHDEDPSEKGWIGTDRKHMSDAGMDAIADALAATGFVPGTQP